MSGQNPALGNNEFWVRCPACKHAWVAAYMPMPIEAFVAIGERIICPKCGDTKGILCGKGDYLPARDGYPDMTP